MLRRRLSRRQSRVTLWPVVTLRGLRGFHWDTPLPLQAPEGGSGRRVMLACACPRNLSSFPQVRQVLQRPRRHRAPHAHQGLRHPLRHHRVREGSRPPTALVRPLPVPFSAGQGPPPHSSPALAHPDLFFIYFLFFSHHVQAGKFDIIPTMINIGSGLALLGVVSDLDPSVRPWGWDPPQQSLAQPGEPLG